MEGQFPVALEGGSPWGFTLQGGVDFRSPLRVGRVTGGGRAANGGLTVGDYILAINEQPTDTLKHLEAQQIIKKASGSLTLMCTKIRPTVTSPTPTKSISFTFSPSPLSYTTSPIVNGPRTIRTPRSPKTPSVTVAKPPPPSVKWTPTQLHNGHPNGDQNGGQNDVTEPASSSPPANVQVFDAKLESIQHFVIEPTVQQENGVNSSLERNGDLSDEGVQCDGVEVDMGEWEVVEAPPPQDEVEQLMRAEEERREREEQQRREREEREERERKEREEWEERMREERERKERREREERERREREEQQRREREEQQRREREEEKELVVPTSKGQGWYKQMFQSFQTTVEELYPGATTTKPTAHDSPPRHSEDTYCYDHRGLRVRRGSASNVESETSVQRLLVEETSQRPRSATTASITTTGDVVSASKKPTSYKTSRYTTGESRNYWKKKDEEHIEWDKKRRSSQDPPSPLVNQHSPDHYTTKMMHPLLSEQQETDGPQKPQQDKAAKQSELFTRIDPTKLHGALDNAVKLGTLEQEGVPSAMLTQVAQTLEEDKMSAKTKPLLPPPGPKAKAIYNFDAQNEKELSFKKGDILDLTHTVDDNWLEGALDGKSGIFPKTYIKVLTRDQARQILAPKDEKYARALYDFDGQAKKELSFNRGDTLTVTRKIDANWYEGYLGDQKGIFPITYVQLLEEGTQ